MSRRFKQAALHGGQFVVGGVGYGALELVWRGYTHISMIIAGGICLWMLMAISGSRHCLAVQCVTGAGCITMVEFGIGCIVNLWLGLEVWDYSQEKLHLLGQICPRFFALWCVLCAGILPVCRHGRGWLGRAWANQIAQLRKIIS